MYALCFRIELRMKHIYVKNSKRYFAYLKIFVLVIQKICAQKSRFLNSSGAALWLADNLWMLFERILASFD